MAKFTTNVINVTHTRMQKAVKFVCVQTQPSSRTWFMVDKNDQLSFLPERESCMGIGSWMKGGVAFTIRRRGFEILTGKGAWP